MQPEISNVAASNRQKKLLRFFNVSFSPNISKGAAGWEISGILSTDEGRQRWDRYLYITRDFDNDSDQLKPFDPAALQAVQIPEGWSSERAAQQARDELVEGIIRDKSPFDPPQPEVVFEKRTFIFTGKFKFGQREACQKEVLSRGGLAPGKSSVSTSVDDLVIGTEGSTAWSKGTYGEKIERAIDLRRSNGKPAIISEDHWIAALKKTM